MKINRALVWMVLAAVACSSAPKKTETAESVQRKESIRDRIAVLDLKPDGIQASEARKISELIRTEIINTGKYIVIERSRIDLLLKEQGFTQIGFTDESSAVKLGKLLAAQKILIGTAMRLGESIVITGRVVDIEKGIAEQASKVAVKKEEDMIYSVSEFISQLSGQQTASSNLQQASTSVIIRTGKKLYGRGEDITVTFSHFPGTKYDYISLARKSASPADHYTYQYTNKLKEGTITFYRGISDPGEYEARAHTEYSKGSKNYQAAYTFTVK